MNEFTIKSSDSDLKLVLSDIEGDYFNAQISSSHINAKRKVYAYTDAYGFANLFEYLASQTKPWDGKESWSSLEQEFEFTASCSTLGTVTFTIELSHYGCVEEWSVKTEIKSEFGQLPSLAKSAREFFGESPS